MQVVGVNAFTETEPSPLAAIARRRGAHRDDRPGGRARAGRAPRSSGAPTRDDAAVDAALERAARGRGDRREPVPATIDARPRRRHRRRVGRRAARGVRRVPRARPASARSRPRRRASMLAVREHACRPRRSELGGPIRLLVGKPGLDGHSNGAEQIAVAARDAGHGGRVPGHPADPGADRGRGARRGRRRRRAVDPVGLAPRARARDRPAAPRRRASTRPSSSAGSSPTPTRPQLARRRASPASTRRRTTGSPTIMGDIADWPSSTAAADWPRPPPALIRPGASALYIASISSAYLAWMPRRLSFIVGVSSSESGSHSSSSSVNFFTCSTWCERARSPRRRSRSTSATHLGCSASSASDSSRRCPCCLRPRRRDLGVEHDERGDERPVRRRSRTPDR